MYVAVRGAAWVVVACWTLVNVVFYLKMTLYGCVFFSQEGIGHHPLEGRIFVLLQNICGAFYKYVLFPGGDV